MTVVAQVVNCLDRGAAGRQHVAEKFRIEAMLLQVSEFCAELLAERGWPKTGYGVPYGYWMREPLADYLRSVVLDSSSQRSGLFDLAVAERTIAEHVEGRRNHESLLYKLLNLALWHREYLS